MEYYELLVFGEIHPSIAMHKNEEAYKLHYVRGIVTYVENSSDLPSTYVPLHLRKTSANTNEGKISFSFKKASSGLEEIHEDEEYEELEEYRMSQVNIKDTLLTIESFQDGDSDDSDCDNKFIHDTIDRKESDDIGLIKEEAIVYDKNESDKT